MASAKERMMDGDEGERLDELRGAGGVYLTSWEVGTMGKMFAEDIRKEVEGRGEEEETHAIRGPGEETEDGVHGFMRWVGGLVG